MLVAAIWALDSCTSPFDVFHAGFRYKMAVQGENRVTLSEHSFLPTSPNWAEEGLKDEAPSYNGLR